MCGTVLMTILFITSFIFFVAGILPAATFPALSYLSYQLVKRYWMWWQERKEKQGQK